MKLRECLRRLTATREQTDDPDGIYFYVRCGRCGQALRVRASRRFDLMSDFEQGGYVLHKEMMDGTCFSLMYATVRFDENYRILSREIEGGEFITEEEFQKATR